MNHDIPQIRCRRLGHQVKISYCYRAEEDGPCRLILACWEEILPNLKNVLLKLIPEDKWKYYFLNSPKDKLTTLIDLIERAKK